MSATKFAKLATLPNLKNFPNGANVQRSIFLGDKVKGPFTAHVGYLTVKLKF
jgi:hypothetical protein